MNQMSSNPFFSFHGFIFPFEWKQKNTGARLLEAQTDLNGTVACFSTDQRWKRMKTMAKPESKALYNEAVYFYEFIRPSLYDIGSESTLLHTYRFKVKEDTCFIISRGAVTYTLRIESIELRLYQMGVGALSFQMINDQPSQAGPEDILSINQYGRRLFPPFYNISHESPDTAGYYTEQQWEAGLAEHPELPDSLVINQAGKNIWSESYKEYRDKPDLNLPPSILHFLLPATFIQDIHITPVLDDRMFVVGWYGNDELSKAITTDYRQNDWWYRYLFVDVTRTVQNSEMMADLLHRHSYMRWSDWGTAFGIARYSFVCLTAKKVPAFIVAHVRTLYMRMAELALMQRACVLRFSEEVTEISSIDTADSRLDARMASLFRQYLRFVNKFSFREITAQEQGIEMYDLLRKSMRLDEQVSALETEIRELHNYAATLAEQTRNEKLDLLTYIGAYMAGPGFIASYYAGINYSMKDGIHWLIMIFLFAVYGGLVWLMMRLTGKRRLWIGILILAYVFFALFGVPHYFK